MNDDKKQILARRAQLIAVALATLNLEACKPSQGQSPPPEICLSAQPEPCLSVRPEPCLSVQPEPCLSQPAAQDAGPAEPQVCLSRPPDDDGPYAKPPPDRG